MPKQEQPDFTNLSYARRHRDLGLKRAEESELVSSGRDQLMAKLEAEVEEYRETWRRIEEQDAWLFLRNLAIMDEEESEESNS